MSCASALKWVTTKKKKFLLENFFLIPSTRDLLDLQHEGIWLFVFLSNIWGWAGSVRSVLCYFLFLDFFLFTLVIPAQGCSLLPWASACYTDCCICQAAFLFFIELPYSPKTCCCHNEKDLTFQSSDTKGFAVNLWFSNDRISPNEFFFQLSVLRKLSVYNI